MSIQSACRAPLAQDLTTHMFADQDLSRPKCPRCGSVLLVAEKSVFNLKGRICHSWSCDDCGNAFMTSIRLWPQ